MKPSIPCLLLVALAPTAFSIAEESLPNSDSVASVTATMDDIAAAWAQRAAACQSARFKWHVNTFDSMSRVDARYESTETYWFGLGTRRRYHQVGKDFYPEGGLRTVDETYTDDGDGQWLELFPPNDRHPVYSYGTVGDHPWGKRELFPILWCFRKTKPAYAFDVERLRIADRRYPVEDRFCILLEETTSPKKNLRRVVVDRQQAFSIIRATVSELSGRFKQ